MTLVWKRRDRIMRRDLAAGRSFPGHDFSGVNLADVNMRGYDLHGCRFAGADLTACDLREAILVDCDFTNARLTGAQLDRSDLSGSCLNGAYLIATELPGACMDNVSAIRIIYDQATVWPTGLRPPKPTVGLLHGARWDTTE